MRRSLWHDMRLIPTALVAWGASAILVTVRPGPRALMVCAAASLLCAAALLSRVVGQRRRWARVPCGGIKGHCVAALLAVAVIAGLGVWRLDPWLVQLRANPPADPVTVIARVVTEPRHVGGIRAGTKTSWWARIDVAAASTDQRGRSASVLRASVPLTVFGTGPTPAWLAWVECTGTFSVNPGGATDSLRASTVRVVRGPPSWTRWSNIARAATRQASAGLPDDARALVPGVAIGDTSEVSDQLSADMKRAGLTHLTAVSGAHFAILASMLWSVLGFARAGPRVRALAVVVLIAGLVILVRPEASVVRAAGMALVSVVGMLARRRSTPTPALATTTLVLLLADPTLAVSIGFALSALATFGLVHAAPVIEERCHLLPTRLRSEVAVALAAYLVCAPVVILIAPSLYPWAVLANVAAAPLVVPLTLLSAAVVALSPFVPQIAVGLAWLAQWPALWIAWVARATRYLPWAEVRWLGGVAGMLLLAVVAVGCFLIVRQAPAVKWYTQAYVMPLLRWYGGESGKRVCQQPRSERSGRHARSARLNR
ncbi:ComEC/Rec2 family competence protein [Rarobacter incanus]|uniref:Competence protein ComEC n=1 Tax=Rarobacter incanus TaxID=153494 RepID=A0A542SNX1_9MICO|nr:ComEC/Rec2 family competence protein [Rarobacter incanus]TQK75957.1 competence protein ComEC [Rarobacter incanus]